MPLIGCRTMTGGLGGGETEPSSENLKTTLLERRLGKGKNTTVNLTDC